MKAITVLSSVVTAATAADYLTRLAKLTYSDLSRAGAICFDDQAEKIVSAGFLTWENVEEIEITACQGLT